MQDNELAALLTLQSIHGLGPLKIRTLINTFKSCEGIFHLSIQELSSVDGINYKIAERIVRWKNFEKGRRNLEICKSKNIHIQTCWDVDYPLLLKSISSYPVVLYQVGNKLSSRMDCLSIVGTRTPTHYGKTITEKITKYLTEFNWTVVSGLARGIDTIAHTETLKHKSSTIAVLGSGVDQIYPPENRKLAERIVESGTIISEFPLGSKPETVNFPLRNRIISGLCHGVCVIEAGNRSGAILTALNAVDQNREVFSVPGRINDTMSTGCNRLIKNGAIPLIYNDLILENIKNRLFHPVVKMQTTLALDLTETESLILEQISNEPVSLEFLERNAKLEYQEMMTLLLNLEMKGVIKQLNGGYYIRA